jgi:hypothetical protein
VTSKATALEGTIDENLTIKPHSHVNIDKWRPECIKQKHVEDSIKSMFLNYTYKN